MIGKLHAPAALRLPQVKLGSALVALLLIAALTAGLLVSTRSGANAAYQTQPVVQQDLTQTVTASGTVNPQDTVNVGTQVSGTINAIYVDYNSKVHKGQVLAELDTSQLQAQLAQAQASLSQAQAQAAAQSQNAQGAQANIGGSQAAIDSAQATVAKSQSALAVADETVARDRSLIANGYISQSQAGRGSIECGGGSERGAAGAGGARAEPRAEFLDHVTSRRRAGYGSRRAGRGCCGTGAGGTGPTQHAARSDNLARRRHRYRP